MYEIDYPLVGGGHVTVATVRPVTLLGDTAVAVNPADERYRDLIGRTRDRAARRARGADHRRRVRRHRRSAPARSRSRPAHDPNDFEIGRRHGLAEIQVIGFDGRMTGRARASATPVSRSPRRPSACSPTCASAGSAARSGRTCTRVGHCQRSGARVEPLVSLQWFCRMDELAAPAIAAVRDGRVRFHPKGAERIFFGWMDAIRPWCVSRQLWWGHQLPVWYCENDHVDRAGDGARALPRVRHPRARARPRRARHVVLVGAVAVRDARLARRDARDLATFYPGNVLSTAREIINLWVARMLMMGIEFLGEEPFSDVVIHSVVQAADGRRMSKSLGTGIDPLELIERYGADATRYGLLKMSSTQDVRFAEGMIDEGRGLTNKLWNAGRLILHERGRRRSPQPLVRRVRRRLGADASRSRDRGGLGADRRVRPRRGRQGALPLRLERRLRLVPRGRQGASLLATIRPSERRSRPRCATCSIARCACAIRCCRT